MRLKFRVFSLATLFALSLGACMQTENSNEIDDEKYKDIPGASADYKEARFIISQNCGSCHTYHTMLESELAAANVIALGNPGGSELFYRLRGSSGALGPKNMPPNGAISSGDLNQIKIWILGATGVP